MHARDQSGQRRFVEHIQEHESTGRLGKALWQSDECPAVDTNVSISTRRAFSISTSEAANISGGPGQRELLVCVEQEHLHFPAFTLLCRFGTGNAFSSSSQVG
jgi:hypothetical protein